MLHIGKAIFKTMKAQRRTATWLANEICVTRTHIYKIFEKENLDILLLIRISKALNHDFFADISNDISTHTKQEQDVSDIDT